METIEEILSELIETRNLIQNNNYNPDRVKTLIQKADSIMVNRNNTIDKVKSNLIKSLLITFNVSNFSDLTVLFNISSDNVQIIEYAGSDFIYTEFHSLIELGKNFYKDIDNIKVKGDRYKLFYESMENDNGIYTIITLTQSKFFKPSKFHMLSDIIMDITRSIDMSDGSVFNDLFEDTAIGINSYIEEKNLSVKEFYLFKFDNIYDFFIKMGFEILIELSELIKKKLTEVFSEESAIFRFSISEYIVVSSGKFISDKKSYDLNDTNILDFNYKGIVLNHRCIKIPYSNNQSIYDVFETIYLVNNRNYDLS